MTGATGGLGRILAPMLRESGHDVRVTGRNRAIGAELEQRGFPFIAVDLTRDELAPLLQGVQTVFHLAALSSPWGAHDDFVAANMIATGRLLDAARAAGCSRFVFASTPSIYCRRADQIGISERTPLPPRFANSYAQTKYAAEQMVLAAAEPGFATIALRPRAVIGPHDTALLPRLLRAANKGRVPLPGGGTALIEPTDARDAARAFLAAERSAEAASGMAFNISGGRAVAVADLTQHVFERLGRSVRLMNVPKGLALFGARVLEGLANALPSGPEPLLTLYGVMVIGWSQTFDLNAARSKLDWEPRHSPFEAIDWALAEMGHA